MAQLTHNAERAAPSGSTVLARWNAERQQQRSAVQAPARRPATRMVRRSFDAAAVDHLTASFTGEHVSLNEDLERTLRRMRGRSRQLYKNNDYVKKFMRMVMNAVVGPNGFSLSVPCLRNDGTTIDEADKALCEKVFAKWAKRGVCDVTGRLSLIQLERLLMLIVARDGEAIVRRVRDRSINAFGYAVQVIDPVLLDESYRADFPDGRRIRMGVEVNAWGKPIAYHFLQDVESAWAGRRIRVPAEEVWHFFIQEEPTQLRGVPWIHSAMRRLNDLGGYEQAAVIAARVGASNMGFYIPPDGSKDDASGLADEALQVQDADGNDTIELVRDATPGTFEKLPPGYDFKKFDPDYPHQNFDAFVKAMLRGVASGIGADYNTLANDLEGVNFSSIRSGKLETQDEWLCIQGWFRECFLEPLFPEWLDSAFVSGQLAPLPVSKYDKYNVATWQGRRWPWVDPYKDMQAIELELKNALTSPSDVMRERGRDPETVWRQLEKDLERTAKIRKLLAELQPKPAPPASPAGGSASDDKKESVDG